MRFHGILVNMALFSLSRLLVAEKLAAPWFFPFRFSFVFPTIASLPRMVVHQVGSPGPILCNATSLRWASVANHSQQPSGRMPWSAELVKSGKTTAAVALCLSFAVNSRAQPRPESQPRRWSC